MRYAYYPGCSSHSTARDMHESAAAVARVLGIELVELKGWSCCGATSAHQTDRILSDALPSANLLLAKEMGLDTVVTCAACYSRMKTANHEVQSSQDIRNQVAEVVGQDYDGSVEVRHFVEILLEDTGLDKIRSQFKKSLNGLKVASYYGCLLVRPSNVTGFDDAENPQSLDKLVTAMGGQSLEWPYKVECCGGGLSLTRADVTARLSAKIVEAAVAEGADCIAVACPMCQSSLDLRRKDIDAVLGKKNTIPVLYITQLLGLCLGIPEKELGLSRLMVPAGDILKSLQPAAIH